MSHQHENTPAIYITHPPHPRELAFAHQAHKPPPPTQRPTHHSSTTSVEQYVLTNPQRTAAQQYGSTHHNGTPGTPGPGVICTFLRFSAFRGRARAVPGEDFHASRSRSWNSSVAVSPGIRRAGVGGGRGMSVRLMGVGWRPVERAVRNEYWNRILYRSINNEKKTTTT